MVAILRRGEMRTYYVYIMSSWSRCLYIGVTGDLVRRVGQHKGLLPYEPGFPRRYRVSRLVYFESTGEVHAALAREKQLKGWLRSRKLALIAGMNPQWNDMAAAWPHIELPE